MSHDTCTPRVGRRLVLVEDTIQFARAVNHSLHQALVASVSYTHLTLPTKMIGYILFDPGVI